MEGGRAERLAGGDRVAYVPGTRREIHFADHVLMLREAKGEQVVRPLRLSDFSDRGRFEVCGGDRPHAERALPGGGLYVSRLYRDRSTGQFYQVCAKALEYRVGADESFVDSEWLRLER